MPITHEDLVEMTKDLPFPDGLTDEQVIEKLKIYTDYHHPKGLHDVTAVEALFKSLGLEEYTEAFVDYGYDDSTFFDKLTEDELQDIFEESKMKKGHQLKFRAWLAKTIVCTGEFEYVGVTRYTGEYVMSTKAGRRRGAGGALAAKAAEASSPRIRCRPTPLDNKSPYKWCV